MGDRRCACSVRLLGESQHDLIPIRTADHQQIITGPFDALRQVWPSIWTKGNDWPNNGEIDIIEAVNLVAYNQMALHTQNGCTQPSGVTQSGTTGSTNCTQDARCTVAEDQPNS